MFGSGEWAGLVQSMAGFGFKTCLVLSWEYGQVGWDWVYNLQGCGIGTGQKLNGSGHGSDVNRM